MLRPFTTTQTRMATSTSSGSLFITLLCFATLLPSPVNARHFPRIHGSTSAIHGTGVKFHWPFSRSRDGSGSGHGHGSGDGHGFGWTVSRNRSDTTIGAGGGMGGGDGAPARRSPLAMRREGARCTGVKCRRLGGDEEVGPFILVAGTWAPLMGPHVGGERVGVARERRDLCFGYLRCCGVACDAGKVRDTWRDPTKV